MSDVKAAELGLSPLDVYRSFAVSGVDPDVIEIGPAEAVPKVFTKADIPLEKVGLIELDEAFSAQSLVVIRALDLDIDIVNVNGVAIALGHPIGCTGARQVVTIIHEALRRKIKFGLVTMCIGGGKGAVGVFEFIS